MGDSPTSRSSQIKIQFFEADDGDQAQKMGSVKDIQSHLRHSRPDTTARAADSVREMVGSVYLMLMNGGEENILLPIATNIISEELALSC